MRIIAIFAFLFAGLGAATSITSNGITWTFNADYTVGTYANGDPYVVAPSGLSITNIDPASTDTSGRVINGSMINPAAGMFPGFGFDSAADTPGWNPALNVARPGGNDLGVGNPLVVAAGSSLISTRSFATPANRPQVADAAVLTIVASAPAAGSFRPPYSGSDKTHYWNKSSIDYTKLSNKAAVSGTAPTLAGVASDFSKVWIDFYTSSNGRDIHAGNNQPEYGGNMARLVANASVCINMAATDAEKEQAVVNLIQYGLDVYGVAKNGGNWENNGGHNIGRKFPLLLAGILLNDAAILAYGDKTQHNIFQEDQQMWVTDASDYPITHYTGDGRPRDPYFDTPVTFSSGTTNINYSGTPLQDQYRVKFSTTGTLPAELNTSDVYIVDSTGTGVFQVHAGAWGGTLVSFSSAGTGVHTATMIGIPEWGEKHSTQRTRDASNWGAYYRDVTFPPNTVTALGARMVSGMRDYWNYQVFFDYADLVMRVDSSGGNFSTWFRNLWAAYRYGGGSPPSTPSALASSLPSFTGGTLTWSDNSSGANEESYYEIQMSTTGGGAGFSTLMTVPANIGTGTMTQALSALPSGRTRYFRVRAVNAADVSAWSSEASLTTWNLGAPPKNRSPRKVFTR